MGFCWGEREKGRNMLYDWKVEMEKNQVTMIQSFLEGQKWKTKYFSVMTFFPRLTVWFPLNRDKNSRALLSATVLYFQNEFTNFLGLNASLVLNYTLSFVLTFKVKNHSHWFWCILFVSNRSMNTWYNLTYHTDHVVWWYK